LGPALIFYDSVVDPARTKGCLLQTFLLEMGIWPMSLVFLVRSFVR